MAALWQFELGKLWDNISKINIAQGWFILGILFVIGSFFLAYKKLVPGTVRQASNDKERDDTIGVLKAENARLILEKDEAEKREREERHRANNLQMELNGIRWAWDNSGALRQRADQVEEKQKEHNGNQS